MSTPLALGILAAEGIGVRRSGIRWLRADGHVCRPGELVGQIEIRIVHRGAKGPLPFKGEQTLQVGLAAPVGGRLRIEDRTSAGGWLDFLAVHDWSADEVVASIETDDTPGPHEAPLPMRLLMLAGRRMVWAMDTTTSLLPGWNLQARAWWGERPPATTLLCLGICDAVGFLRGDQGCFAELFEKASFPGHVVHATEHPIAICSPILFEQLTRTPAQFEEIAFNLRRMLGKGPVAPTAADYMFAGALLTQMSTSPIMEQHDVLGADGLRRLAPADVILLSATAEGGRLMRHRELGYTLQFYNNDLGAAGPAIRSWLERAFEPVRRSVDDVRRDLERLIDETHARTGARFIVMNRMSSSGRETVDNYAAFETPLDEQLTSVRTKAINLMLHDLSSGRPAAILDVDALAAALGGGDNLPDGVHSSRLLQDALRRELLRLMVPGARQAKVSAVSPPDALHA